jgi:4-diphosphocytidyl-2-C-methyl-D-erythritol kinase
MMQGALGTEYAWPAPAKLNLFIHITGRRADGYHELQSVFQFLDYGDDIFFVPRSDSQVHRVSGPDEFSGEADLAVRAALSLQQASGCGLGVDIHLKKRIPIGAGLGGGSSDAATTLVALNEIWGLHWPLERLAALGLKLGADVPVFVHGSAAWAEGIGERLTPLQLPEPWYLVVTPDCHVSTAEIYAAPELKRDTPAIRMPAVPAELMHNDFLPVVRRRHPQVAEALDFLDRHARARLTGTGASVFAEFETREQARRVQAVVPSRWTAFVARGLNRSPLQHRCGLAA